MILDRSARWLEEAGIELPKKPDGTIDAKIEMSGSFALEPEDIEEKPEKVPAIRPGDELYLE
jgi:hypothetical protein